MYDASSCLQCVCVCVCVWSMTQLNDHWYSDRITHTTAFVTPVVEHWLEREAIMAQYVAFT